MGSICSCFRGRHSEEETVDNDDSEFNGQTLHLNRSKYVTENTEEPVYVTACVSQSSDEDVCPTCFEEYTDQNPKIVAKCKHHYHLSCIYEWKERSETCPACSRKVMDFAET